MKTKKDNNRVLVIVLIGIIIIVIVNQIFFQKKFPISRPTEELQDLDSKKVSDEKIADLEKQVSDLTNNKLSINNATSEKSIKTISKTETPSILEPAIPVSKIVNPPTIDVSELSNPKIEIIKLGQIVYDKPYYYGSFYLDIRVTAGEEDIFIPLTTSDSVMANHIGFPYEVIGDYFSGDQKSGIKNCGIQKTITRKEYCFVQSNKSIDLFVVVWLTPNLSGNYAVRFNDITYLQGDNHKEKLFNLSKETKKVYIK